MRELAWLAAGGLVAYVLFSQRMEAARKVAADAPSTDADRAGDEPEKGTDAFDQASSFVRDVFGTGGIMPDRGDVFEPPVIKSGGCGCGCK